MNGTEPRRVHARTTAFTYAAVVATYVCSEVIFVGLLARSAAVVAVAVSAIATVAYTEQRRGGHGATIVTFAAVLTAVHLYLIETSPAP